MNGIKCGDELRIKLESVSLNERKGIVRLRINIHAHDLETRLSITGPGTARAAKEI